MKKQTQKSWKRFEDQLDLLKSRGLIINDEHKAIGYLKTLGYYRLSGYLYAFRQIDPNNHKQRLDDFIDGSHFEDVKQLYIFDKKLRQLSLDALERIEIALRVNIAYALGRYAPLAHRDNSYFDTGFDHNKWLKKYNALLDREEKTKFVQHHINKYGDLPIWAGCELWDFGTMSILYKGMLAKDKDHIAKIYKLQAGKHLQTHLHAFNIIRNISAHHGRLWNRAMTKPISKKGLRGEQWQKLSPQEPFIYFCLMKRMLDIICPNSTWGSRFLAVLNEFPQMENNAINLKEMGLTIELIEWDLWKY